MYNPLNAPKHISGVTHPLIADMYLKHDFSHHDEDVLVIETKKHADDMDGQEHASFDSYLVDLLLDLESLKARAEKKAGHIDRIDIRTL